MIQVRDLSKLYYVGDVAIQALFDASFDIEQGEFVAIFGNSGSGKSTLLHLIGLLDEPTGGKISINGIKVSELPEPELDALRLNTMGYVFQEYNILPEMTVLENVILPGYMSGLTRTEAVKRATEIIGYVDLSGRINHLPAELSGGERQRVSIARSLINNPKILLADEPTANLDSRNSDNVISLFKKLNLELGITILLVTHNPEYIKFATKVLHLKDGKIERISIQDARSNKAKKTIKIKNQTKDTSVSTDQYEPLRYEPLRGYITLCKKNRVPREEVERLLLKVGWKPDEVKSAINKYGYKRRR